MSKATFFSLCFILVISFPVISEASQIDFAWSIPESHSYKKGSEDEKEYLIWCYSIRNTIDKEITVPIATLLTTDTRKYYEDEYFPEIAEKVSDGVGEYISADEMKGKLGPGVTKKGIAIFEGIDPHAKKINIFVTGLSHLLFWKLGQVDYAYKITYRKSGNKWILEEHGFSKDSSHKELYR